MIASLYKNGRGYKIRQWYGDDMGIWYDNEYYFDDFVNEKIPKDIIRDGYTPNIDTLWVQWLASISEQEIFMDKALFWIDCISIIEDTLKIRNIKFSEMYISIQTPMVFSEK